MRNWINLVENVLNEAWADTIVIDGKQVDLFSNPSRTEWSRLFRDYPRGLRGHILVDGSVVVWDAMNAVHTDMANYLSDHGKQITSGYRYFYPDRIEFNDLNMETNDEDGVNEAGEITHYGWYVRVTYDTTVANASIIAFYGSPPKIIGIDYDANPTGSFPITREWVEKYCALRG